MRPGDLVTLSSDSAHTYSAIVFDPTDCMDVVGEIKRGSVWTVIRVDPQYGLDLEVMGPNGVYGVVASDELEVIA